MATLYSLAIQISEAALQVLYASGQKVVVGKASPQGAPNVAWVVFQPLPTNLFTWYEEQYGIFASLQPLQPGEKLIQTARVPIPAQSGMVYPYQSQGIFGAPQGGGAPGVYTVFNQFGSPMTTPAFGLSQNATVDGVVQSGPVSASSVYQQNFGYFTPSATLYVWVQAGLDNGTVLGPPSAPQTVVAFGGSVTKVSLTYDPSSGKFVPS